MKNHEEFMRGEGAKGGIDGETLNLGWDWTIEEFLDLDLERL